MRQVVVTMLTVIITGLAVAYAAGLFTPEVRVQQSCTVCRAVLYQAREYGVAYSREEDSSFTRWYRDNIDPSHGVDPLHPHSWHNIDCSATEPGTGLGEYDCANMPAIFLLRPDVQLAVLQDIPDRATQAGVLQAITSDTRRATLRRIALLIEYYHVDRAKMSWAKWWSLHAQDFGLAPVVSASR